jgi:hypothetical protein
VGKSILVVVEGNTQWRFDPDAVSADVEMMGDVWSGRDGSCDANDPGLSAVRAFSWWVPARCSCRWRWLLAGLGRWREDVAGLLHSG